MDHRYFLDRLRRRIDEIERRHDQEIKALRAELETIGEREKPPAASPTAEQPPPIPVSELKITQPKVEAVKQPAVAPKAEPEVISPKPPQLPSSQREIDFGRVWFVRIGVVILLTGLVFLGNYAYQNWVRELPNGLRLASLLGLAGAWIETGRRITKRANLQRFGEVVMAGGLGFFYYCVYAAHHVERLQVIENTVLAGGLMVVAAVAITAVAWRQQSRLTATIGMLLASYTTVVQPLGWLACVSNSALACMGLFFLTRRGWATPGWVAMLGMYLAFALWQVLGAAGHGGDELATLWFLAPSWLVFAVAGVTPGAGAALSNRARAWFTGANNGLFFGLFAVLWLRHYGSEDFWMITGALGLLWIGFGIYGRRALPVAGSVNLSQGLLLLAVSWVLKLEGYHLPLAFAIEALALAAAYRRFGGRVEAVFSLVAGVTAAIWLFNSEEPPPVWSAALMLLPLAAATWLMRLAAGFERRHRFREFARRATSGLFWSTWIVFIIGVLIQIEHNAHVVAAMAALALGWTALRFDTKRRMPELAWGTLAMLVVVIILLLSEAVFGDANPPWIILTALAAHLTGTRLWRTDVVDPALPMSRRAIEWLHALSAGIAAWVVCAHSAYPVEFRFLLMLTASLGLAAAAIWTQAGRLAIVAGMMSIAAVTVAWLVQDLANDAVWVFFAATPLALVALPLWFVLPAGKLVPHFGRTAGAICFRIAALVAWVVAVHRIGGSYAPDGWAITAMILILGTMALRVKIPVESMVFLGIAALDLWVDFIFVSKWSPIDLPADWRGGGVVAAMLLLVFTHRERVAVIEDNQQRRQIIAVLACVTCIFATLWATQMLVWRVGWDGAVALWSMLGFLTVSAGLWQRLRSLRLAGLLLLIIALAKLFAMDVWDFTAFTRVMSFIALGIALILLGLFYNHFAASLKKWL